MIELYTNRALRVTADCCNGKLLHKALQESMMGFAGEPASVGVCKMSLVCVDLVRVKK